MLESIILHPLDNCFYTLLTNKLQWSFVDEKKPAFELVVINPDVIIGPVLQPVPGPKSVNETNEFACYAFINGTHKTVEDAMFAFWDFVSCFFFSSPTNFPCYLIDLINLKGGCSRCSLNAYHRTHIPPHGS